MANLLRIKRINEISLVDKGASGTAGIKPAIVIAKRKEDKMSDKPKDSTNPITRVLKSLFGKEAVSTMTLDEVLAGLDEQKRAVVLAALEQAAKAMHPEEPAPEPEQKPEEEPQEKGKPMMKRDDLPEDIRKQLADGEKAGKEVAELKKRLDEMADEKELSGFIEKAKEMPYLAGKSTVEIGKALRSIQKSLPEKEAATVMDVLQRSNDAVKTSQILADLGVPGGQAFADDSAYGQAMKMAKGLVEKSATQLSSAEAMVKVFEQNPDLHARYRDEMRERAKNS